MPGISPLDALSLKQIRQTPNLRKYPRLLPQSAQRFLSRVLNFSFLGTKYLLLAIFNRFNFTWFSSESQASSVRLGSSEGRSF